MFPLEAFEETLKKATGIFEMLSIGYHLTGGATSIAYVEPRYTQDLDLVIDRESALKQIDSLINALHDSDFYIEEKSVREAIAARRMFQLIDIVESMKVDVYTRELIPGELERSMPFELYEGIEVPIASRVDAVLSKLIWVSPEEQAAVREHAAERNLTALLDEVLAEPDEIE